MHDKFYRFGIQKRVSVKCQNGTINHRSAKLTIFSGQLEVLSFFDDTLMVLLFVELGLSFLCLSLCNLTRNPCDSGAVITFLHGEFVLFGCRFNVKLDSIFIAGTYRPMSELHIDLLFDTIDAMDESDGKKQKWDY